MASTDNGQVCCYECKRYLPSHIGETGIQKKTLHFKGRERKFLVFINGAYYQQVLEDGKQGEFLCPDCFHGSTYTYDTLAEHEVNKKEAHVNKQKKLQKHRFDSTKKSSIRCLDIADDLAEDLLDLDYLFSKDGFRALQNRIVENDRISTNDLVWFVRYAVKFYLRNSKTPQDDADTVAHIAFDFVENALLNIRDQDLHHLARSLSSLLPAYTSVVKDMFSLPMRVVAKLRQNAGESKVFQSALHYWISTSIPLYVSSCALGDECGVSLLVEFHCLFTNHDVCDWTCDNIYSLWYTLLELIRRQYKEGQEAFLRCIQSIRCFSIKPDEKINTSKQRETVIALLKRLIKCAKPVETAISGHVGATRKGFVSSDKIVKGEEKLVRCICKSLERGIQENRAVFVICENDSLVQSIKSHMKEGEKLKSARLHVETESTRHKGISRGDVVLSTSFTNLNHYTNKFGADGGLMVILTFLPPNGIMMKEFLQQRSDPNRASLMHIFLNEERLKQQQVRTSEVKHHQEYDVMQKVTIQNLLSEIQGLAYLELRNCTDQECLTEENFEIMVNSTFTYAKDDNRPAYFMDDLLSFIQFAIAYILHSHSKDVGGQHETWQKIAEEINGFVAALMTDHGQEDDFLCLARALKEIIETRSKKLTKIYHLPQLLVEELLELEPTRRMCLTALSLLIELSVPVFKNIETDPNLEEDIVSELNLLVHVNINDAFWDPTDILELWKVLKEKSDKRKKLLNCIRRIRYFKIQLDEDIMKTLRSAKFSKFDELVEEHVNSEKDLGDILDDVRTLNSLDDKDFEFIRKTVLSAERDLKAFGYPEHLPGHSRSSHSLSPKGRLLKIDDLIEKCKKNRSASPHKVDKDDLVLTGLSVRTALRYWPRTTQLVAFCLLMMGKKTLLEVQTGEGKSCLVAMVAATYALKGYRVDIITSSPLLAERDKADLKVFYQTMRLTVSTNLDSGAEDGSQQYRANVVYGTSDSFAGDILRTEFRKLNVRKTRPFDIAIIDEVDSLMVDKGLQFTYLNHSHTSAGLHHLEPLLAYIWATVSRSAPVMDEHRRMYYRGEPQLFQKLACQLLGEDNTTASEEKMSEEHIVDALTTIEEHVHVKFRIFRIQSGNISCTDDVYGNDEDNTVIKAILLLGEGMTCFLERDESLLIPHKVDVVRNVIPLKGSEHKEYQMPLPDFLRKLAFSQSKVWVRNAFLAMKMREDHEYIVKNGKISHVDMESTGVEELNRMWGDGLQQFLEMKHGLRISNLSLITNFMSNVQLFHRYSTICGVSGTLGSEGEKEFMHDVFDVTCLTIPTHKTLKTTELPGELIADRDAWENRTCKYVKKELQRGRAALVICKSIEIANMFATSLNAEVGRPAILYSGSDEKDQMNRINRTLSSGEFIVATNLASRGTDISVTDEVQQSGGLSVVVTFLPPNERSQKALGRTARSGQPGSVKLMIDKSTLSPYVQGCESLSEAELLRNKLEKDRVCHIKHELTEVKLKEELFSEYCHLVSEMYKNEDHGSDNKMTFDKRIAIDCLHEAWGLWLLDNRERLHEAEKQRKSLLTDLKFACDVDQFVRQVDEHCSPLQNFYHLNQIASHRADTSIEQFDKAADLFKKSSDMDDNWSAISRYNRAFCLLKQKSGNYIDDANAELEKVDRLIGSHKADLTLTKTLLAHASRIAPTDHFKDGSVAEHSFIRHYQTQCYVLQVWETHVKETMAKLNEMKQQNQNVEVTDHVIFSVVEKPDAITLDVFHEFWQLGLRRMFSVDGKPKFSWGALSVCCIGAVECITGTALTVVSCGILAEVGSGLIMEGVSDSIEGAEGMATGKWDWKSWGVSKAMSIGTTLLTGGMSKLASTSMELKTAGKALTEGVETEAKALKAELKASFNIFKEEIVPGLSEAAKTKLKETGKLVAKELGNQVVFKAAQHVEDWFVQKFMDGLEEKVRETIVTSIIEEFQGEPETHLKKSVNKFIQRSGKDKEQIYQALVQLANDVVAGKIHDIGWKTQVLSAAQSLVHKMEDDSKLSAHQESFKAIKEVLLAFAVVDTYRKVSDIWSSLRTTFADDIQTSTKDNAIKDAEKAEREKRAIKDAEEAERERRKEEGFFWPFVRTIIRSVFSSSSSSSSEENSITTAADGFYGVDGRMIAFNKIATIIAEPFSNAIVTVIHQETVNHIAGEMRKHINQKVGPALHGVLGISETKKTLADLDECHRIAYRSDDEDHSIHEENFIRNTELTYSYAQKIKNNTEEGGLLDLRVLSDHLNCKIKVYTGEGDSIESLDHQQTVRSPSLQGDAETIPVKYTPGQEGVTGHYDAIVNGKVLPIESTGNSCLFSAVAKGRCPKATEDDAIQIRNAISDEVKNNPNRYARHVESYEIFRSFNGSHFRFLAIGGAGNDNDVARVRVVAEELGSVGPYKEQRQKARAKGITSETQEDHFFAFSVLKEAAEKNPAEGGLAVQLGGGNLRGRGEEMLTATVLIEDHKLYLSTGSSPVAKNFRKLHVDAIVNNDTRKALQLAIIGSRTEYSWKGRQRGTRYDEETPVSQYKRKVQLEREKFNNMISATYERLQGTNLMTKADEVFLTTWVNSRGYNFDHDPVVSEVIKTCYRK